LGKRKLPINTQNIHQRHLTSYLFYDIIMAELKIKKIKLEKYIQKRLNEPIEFRDFAFGEISFKVREGRIYTILKITESFQNQN